MELELSISRATDLGRTAAAWLLAGSDPRAWLDELARWELDLESVELFALVDGLGLLAVPRAGSTPGVSTPCVPYARTAGGLYLPIDAVLDPRVTERELAAALLGDTYVFHPRAGLIAIDGGARLHVDELLAPPARRETDWNRARPGPPALPALRGLVRIDPPTVELILEEGRGDISSQRVEELPKAPGERRPNPIDRARRAALNKFGTWIIHAYTLAPSGAKLPTWIDPLRSFVKARLKDWTTPHEDARNRELERLAHMLETDPDRGLRHAIPLGGKEADARTRDEGLSGLSDHNPRFELRRARATEISIGADSETYARLQELYRRAADRELDLGRFRRAAYVYHELLDDSGAAAAALKRGGYWTEAAALYRDVLGMPRAAAECFEQGGLLAEAVELHEQHADHERAARVHRRMDREDLAREAFGRAVAKHLKDEEAIEAARLLERELGAVEEALEVLAAHWPTGGRAGEALRVRFALMQRTGRAPALPALVSELTSAADPEDAKLAATLAEALSDLAQSALNPALGALCEDSTRVLASRSLPSATITTAGALLGAVARAGSADPLLGTDTQRWFDRARSRRRRSTPPPGAAPRLVCEFRLQGGIAPVRAVRTRGGFALLGRRPDSSHEDPWTWIDGELDGTQRAGLLPTAHIAHNDRPAVLSANREGDLLIGLGGERLYLRGKERGRLEGLHWAPRGFLSAELVGNDLVVLRIDEALESMLLERYTLDGSLLNTRHVHELSKAQLTGNEHACLAHHRGRSAASLGKQIYVFEPGETQIGGVGSPVERLLAPHLQQLSALVACMESGCALITGSGLRAYPIPLARDIEHPRAAFALDGRLVVAGERELRVYVLESHHARVVASTPLDPRPIVDVVAAGGAHGIALFDAGGGVRVYELPRPGRGAR